VSYVPHRSWVFTDLTVRENLEVAGITRRNEIIERALSLFPALRPRVR
jgi:ABC-type branched-subunit amino acid transport system ATPase component